MILCLPVNVFVLLICFPFKRFICPRTRIVYVLHKHLACLYHPQTKQRAINKYLSLLWKYNTTYIRVLALFELCPFRFTNKNLKPQSIWPRCNHSFSSRIYINHRGFAKNDQRMCSSAFSWKSINLLICFHFVQPKSVTAVIYMVIWMEISSHLSWHQGKGSIFVYNELFFFPHVILSKWE